METPLLTWPEGTSATAQFSLVCPLQAAFTSSLAVTQNPLDLSLIGVQLFPTTRDFPALRLAKESGKNNH